jgi:uroporphyrin-III C-methyltransferase/precorrin-2 dehydrogenase/sirohydrochlorin ferrochelatase
LVNVVDNQALCSFVFPSIVDRSPLLVAISSSGKAPVLSRILREKIEALLPTNLGRLAESASYWRNHLKTHLTTTEARRRFWERVFTGRFASLMVAGNLRRRKRRCRMNWISPNARRVKLFWSAPGRAMPGC